MAVLYDRSVTWGGLVVGTGNKTEVADRLHDALRRRRLRLQPDRRPLQEPGPPARRRHRRPGRDRPQGAVGRPVAGPDRRDRGRLHYPDLDRLLFWRVDKRRSTDELVALGFDAGDWSSGSTGWSPRPSSSGRFRRSRSSGRGRPASTTSIHGGGRARPATLTDGRSAERRPRRRHAVRRRDADRQSRRHHASGARGPATVDADRGRGHAPHAAAARPA